MSRLLRSILLLLAGTGLLNAQQPPSPPVLTSLSLTPSVLENGVATLSGGILDANQTTFTVAINWGDAAAPELIDLPLGTTNFLATHQYGDNHLPGAAFSVFGVNVTVTDGAGANNFSFLSAVYENLLGRQIDPSAQSTWLNYLASGGTRNGVASAITSSTEYLQRVVENAYSTFLYRVAAPPELSYGVTFLQSGNTDEQFIAYVTGSPEYFLNRGNGTDLGFLQAIFTDLLRRPLDPASQQGFLQQLSSGFTRSQVTAEVLSSTEYRGDLVNSFFWRFLYRPPTGAEVSYYVNLLASGGTDEQVIDTLVSSTEYFNLHSGGTASAQLSLTVSNSPPTLSALQITSPVVEGGLAVLTGGLAGPIEPDTAQMLIDWGDGSPPGIFSLPASFSFQHQYLQSSPAYNVTVGVFETDDPGTNYQSLQVQVLAAPATISSLTLAGGLPHLVGMGLPAHTYTIQASENLLDWSNLGGATADSSGQFVFDDRTAPGMVQRFYRILSP